MKPQSKGIRQLILMLGVIAALASSALADVVTDWNRIAQQALLNANSSPVISTRSLAIVQVSVFDALNGIEGHYTPIHSTLVAPPGASRRAAVIQAAYASLLRLLPAQEPFLTAERNASLEAMTSERGSENSKSIARGIAYGQAVADDIFVWRSTDGITPAPPPFLGGMAVGQWRPTPPGLLPGAAVQFGYMRPWAISSPSIFRPAGPPALTSAQYAADLNEVKAIGKIDSLTRTADQTQIAVFWNGNTPVAWNRVAQTLSEQRNLTLSKNARLFALINVAMADAVIACWEAKYHYVFWRPITAIRLASTDGNPDTVEDATWTPLLTTPNHPDYPSGHATVSPAAATVLADYFGDDIAFPLVSESTPGVVRNFASLSQAVQEAFDARIYGGIHFRTACLDGRATGIQVGEVVVGSVAQLAK